MKIVIRSLQLFTLLCIVSRTSFASNQDTIASALGWVKTKTCSEKQGLCDGYYAEPLSLKDVPKPPSYKTVPVEISAKGPVIFRTNGTSILQDHVVIKEPGRLIKADKAILYHDKKTGKIADIKLTGHIRVQEDGKLLLGDKADYNITKNTLTLNGAMYHISGVHELTTVSTPFDAWGVAKKIRRDKNNIIHLKDATYSTCSPVNPTWIMSASEMRLDREEGEGTARNIVLRFKSVPIFYSPYYSFPLNAQRKSGLLPPVMGYLNNNGGSGSSGAYFGIPYYWNIAPNYDLLFTPSWYSERGAQLNGYFRYLTPQSDGYLFTSFLPYDSKFAQFRENTINNPGATTEPYISQLQDSTDQRAFLNYDNNFQFNQSWRAKIVARYMTDPYFAEDFQSEYLTQTTNQIPSFAELDYQGTHWHDLFSVQTYQTLHPLDQSASPTPIQNQYTRLPEYDFGAAYPQFVPNWNFNLSGQFVDFDYNSIFSPLTYQVPVGDRLHLEPSLSRTFNFASYFVTPQITADGVGYFTQLPSVTSTSPRPDYDAARAVPIFDIDSGWYLDRDAMIGNKDYIATLEPRLFYLYTPYLNQNNYPNFDTQLLPFSISNLYALNEFAGFDRIQNANQLTLGLTSHLLREADASDVLTAQIGVIDYFQNQDVCLTNNCAPPVQQTFSPLTGALTWNPNSLWALTTQAAWDGELEQLNNAQIGAQYHFQQRQIAVFNYQFTHGNPDTPFDAFGFSTNTSLLTAGLFWPLSSHWNFFGYTYYDLTHEHPVSQYTGFAYSTCCWALRAIISDDYNGTTQTTTGTQNKFTTNYYVQFLLKGLGSASNRSAETMLTSTLPGFQDTFSNRGHYGYGQSI